MDKFYLLTGMNETFVTTNLFQIFVHCSTMFSALLLMFVAISSFGFGYFYAKREQNVSIESHSND